MYRHMEAIQKENALLAGIYMQNAAELEDQEINLPNNVAELQERLLQARHNIIEARVGWESERMKGVSLTEELQALRDQFAKTIEEAREQSKRLKGNVSEYMRLKAEYEKLQEQLKVARESNEKLDAEFKREMGELREQNIQLITNQVRGEGGLFCGGGEDDKFFAFSGQNGNAERGVEEQDHNSAAEFGIWGGGAAGFCSIVTVTAGE